MAVVQFTTRRVKRGSFMEESWLHSTLRLGSLRLCSGQAGQAGQAGLDEAPDEVRDKIRDWAWEMSEPTGLLGYATLTQPTGLEEVLRKSIPPFVGLR